MQKHILQIGPINKFYQLTKPVEVTWREKREGDISKIFMQYNYKCVDLCFQVIGPDIQTTEQKMRVDLVNDYEMYLDLSNGKPREATPKELEMKKELSDFISPL